MLQNMYLKKRLYHTKQIGTNGQFRMTLNKGRVMIVKK